MGKLGREQGPFLMGDAQALTMSPTKSESATCIAAIPLTLRLPVDADARVRRGEPVTCGIPMPRGLVSNASDIRLVNADRDDIPRQLRVLQRWADGSIRWVLVHFSADVAGEGDAPQYSLEVVPDLPVQTDVPGLAVVRREDEGIEIDTGAARFTLTRQRFPLTAVTVNDIQVVDGDGTQLRVIDGDGRAHRVEVNDVLVPDDAGPLRATVHISGVVLSDEQPDAAPLCELSCRMHFHARSATVQFDLALTNPRAAEHPGNFWDLGDPGSVYFKDVSLTFARSTASDAAAVTLSTERGGASHTGSNVRVYQDSSGGENWQSPTHVNREGKVPLTFRGYRGDVDGGSIEGLRATPIAIVDAEGDVLALSMPTFWQNFPKAVEADAKGVTLSLFPQDFSDVHELQGGELKTHAFHVAFARDSVSDEPLAWTRDPVVASVPPSWYARAQAEPYMLPTADSPHAEYESLIDAALDTEHGIAAKREVIDEFGWRNFGDVWADHESAYLEDGKLYVSHYNNQYDQIQGFATQFMRTGDARWWQLADELATHVKDVDIYHTDADKSAYNHGLFWHTAHYADAATSTHRTYSKSAFPSGGGPAGGHLYAGGLRLHYLMTGDRSSYDAAHELAQYVIDAEDGSNSRFHFVDGGSTGHMSASGWPPWHGPGRSPANAIHVLLDGFALSTDRKFMDTAESLIKRCIHPHDDVAAMDLGNVEHRWYYTMFLQALGAYLDVKAELGEIDDMYAYARGSLLTYARWAADHEHPYLDKPDALEYPNETWAAQDMRKVEVFRYAAMHSEGAMRERFEERADWFFRHAVRQLSEFDTRTFARPIALMMRYGYQWAWHEQHGRDEQRPAASLPDDLAPRRPFVPQRDRVLRKLKLAVAACGVTGLIVIAVLFAVMRGGGE